MIIFAHDVEKARLTEKMKAVLQYEMNKVHAAITGIQGYVPDYILTNKELEENHSSTHYSKYQIVGLKPRVIPLIKGKFI